MGTECAMKARQRDQLGDIAIAVWIIIAGFAVAWLAVEFWKILIEG
jgi:hypothetical protein